MRYLRAVHFLFYFLRLRLEVAFGLHRTANPTGLSWRWRHWDSIRQHHRPR